MRISYKETSQTENNNAHFKQSGVGITVTIVSYCSRMYNHIFPTLKHNDREFLENNKYKKKQIQNMHKYIKKQSYNYHISGQGQ